MTGEPLLPASDMAAPSGWRRNDLVIFGERETMFPEWTALDPATFADPKAVTMRRVVVNNRWPVMLPEHRAERPGWARHEHQRFAAMWGALRGYGGGETTLWDVGAELGDHAAVFAAWGCRLVLIEPNPRAWPCIAATIEANQATDAIAGWCWSFVGDRISDILGPDRLGFAAPPWPPPAEGPCTDRAGMVHLSGRPDPDPYVTQPMTTIDALVAAGFPVPDGLTIDVEGAELSVLRGAAVTLGWHRPRVWLSIHPELLGSYGDDPAQVRRLMDDAGYDGRLLAVDHEEHWEWVPR